MLIDRAGREKTAWPSSTLPVAFWLACVDRQLDGRALFPRDHRPVAFLTPTPRPCLGAEMPAQQEEDDAEGEDADEPYHWISDVEHSQNINRCCAKSCTFKPDGKRGPAPLVQTQLASLQPEDRDSFVGCSSRRVAAQFRHRLQQVQRRLVEDGKVFACDEILDDTLLPTVCHPPSPLQYLQGGTYSTELPALASWYDLILFPVREREWRLHGLLWGPVAVFPGRSLRWLRSLDFQGLGDAVLSEGGITGSASVSTMLAGTAEHVCSMHGPDRIPTLLKRVDSLSRRAG